VPNTGTGLAGAYFNNKTHSGAAVLFRTEAVNFNWGSNSPGPGVNADGFSVRWTGKIEASSSGNFQFLTTSNDGVRLWINGVLVINNWTNKADRKARALGISRREFYNRINEALEHIDSMIQRKRRLTAV
jgi:hypothetical protein